MFSAFLLHALLLLHSAGLGLVLAQTLWPSQNFNTTDVQIPMVKVSKFGKTEPGYLFLTPLNKTAQLGISTIFSDDGELVWYSTHGLIDLRVQELDGKSVLTVWSGATVPEGLGWGTVSIFDESYALVKNVTLEGNFQTFNHTNYPSYMDFHEAQMTEDNSLLVTAVNITTANMSSVGGPEDGWVIDGLFYEIDVATNEVLFRWSAVDSLDQIPLNDSLLPLTSIISGNGSSYENPWGYFHMNSVAKYGSNYLMSSRLLCTIFYIDPNGNVIWRLSGKDRGDFQLGPDTNFCYQHDARIPYMTDRMITITMHDNGDTEYDNTTVTRGLALDLYFDTHIATLNRTLMNPDGPVYAVSQGSYQDLSNGHVLLEHGAVPVIEEYDANGDLTMLFQWGPHYLEQSYRGFRSAWTGKPTTLPIAVGFASDGAIDIYMSWNGATEVSFWNVYTGSPENMQFQTSVARDGFETAVSLASTATYVQVEAVEYDGEMTKSAVVEVQYL